MQRGRRLARERLPFDEPHGVVPNEGGRVIDPHSGRTLAGEYVVGWIKRGPTGVIGTNKKDATETVEVLLREVTEPKGVTAADVDALLDERGVRRVVYAGWLSIDEVEQAAGAKLGRPRVKLCTWDALLETADRLHSSA